MYFDTKAISKYEKRRHKLYKAINNHYSNDTISLQKKQIEVIEPVCSKQQQFKQNFIHILSQLLNPNFNILQVLQILVLQKETLIKKQYQLLQTIVLSTNFNSGHKLSYLIYRFLKQNPQYFKRWNNILKQILDQSKDVSVDGLVFWTNLYFYGFSITSNYFMEKIFSKVQYVILDYLIRMPNFTTWNTFLPRRHLFKITHFEKLWIDTEIKKIKHKFSQIQEIQNQIQTKEVQKRRLNRNNQHLQKQQTLQHKQLNQIQEKYINKYKIYQQIRQKLVYLQRQQGIIEAKRLQQVISECQYFNPQFKLPQLLQKLYKELQVREIKIVSIKKSLIPNLGQDLAFLSQLSSCGSMSCCTDLSCYFLSQLNKQQNLYFLIQHLIDNCHYSSNLDLIMRIVAEINSKNLEIGQYLESKVVKITSQVKMNFKYFTIICQAIKYDMVKAQVVLDYVQRRLTSKNGQLNMLATLKQALLILQMLGQSVYHSTLKINIQFNFLINLIERIIQKKQLGFSFMFGVKCLKSYLRTDNSKNNTSSTSRGVQQISQLSEYNLKQNFQIILLRINQLLDHSSLLKTQQKYQSSRILRYLTNCIQSYPFTQTFYCACFLQSLNKKQLSNEIILITLNKIQSNFQINCQNSVRWARFFGELYNYQIVGRKKFVQGITQVISIGGTLFQHRLKCVMEAINVAKSYLLDTEIQRKDNQYVTAFIINFKKAILLYLSQKQQRCFDNLLIQHQISDILNYFHPVLMKKLISLEQINNFIQKIKFSSSDNSLLSINLFKILDYYMNIENVNEFDPTTSNQKKIKKQNEKKLQYKQKIIYKQKLQQVELSQQTKIEYPLKIQHFNQNYRPQQTDQVEPIQKQLIKQQSQQVQKQLIQMMGFNAEIFDRSMFPAIHDKLVTFNNVDIKQQKIKVITRKAFIIKNKKDNKIDQR